MKKIVILPDSFKGSLSAETISEILKQSVQKRFPRAQIVAIPISDGGEGFLSFYQKTHPNSQIHWAETYDAQHSYRSVPYLLDDRWIVIESAQIVAYDEDKQGVYQKSSYGIGYLMRKLAKQYPRKKILLSVGGTASIDMGLGAMAALGALFLSKSGQEILPTPENLEKIDRIVWDACKLSVPVKIISDVENPFYGPKGGFFEYSPQKGADKKTLLRLEKMYQNILPKEEDAKYYGSGGGITAAFAHFLNAEIQLGMDFLFEVLKFDKNVQDYDCILTAEGSIDQQSFQGKVIGEIAKKALVYDIPVFAFAGEVYLKDRQAQENLYCIPIHANRKTMKNYQDFSQESLRQSCDLLMALLALKI